MLPKLNSPLLNAKLIILQITVMILAPLWILKLTHYFNFPIKFLFDSRSLIPHQSQQNYPLNSLNQVNLLHTLVNVFLFGIFFVQHILMARLSFKKFCQQKWPMFFVYERLIYNIVSSLLILVILEYQQPQNYILFTLPLWLGLPFCIAGLYFFVDANLQMEGSLLLPYKFSQLFNSRQISIPPNDYTIVQEQTGITMKGSYFLIRHPMQSGCILLLTFGGWIFTLQKIVMLIFMIAFIAVGVRMEEKRLSVKYKQYQNYMKVVSFRFVPFVI